MKSFMIARVSRIQPKELNLGKFLSRLFQALKIMACIVLSLEPH